MSKSLKTLRNELFKLFMQKFDLIVGSILEYILSIVNVKEKNPV